jgi:hypothetical protein
MTTPVLTPEVVEELRRLAEKAEMYDGHFWFSPSVNALYPQPEQAACIAAAKPAVVLALLARLTHLEEQVRKDGEALPDLSSVIAWLENGCDPKHAATELRIYQRRITARLSDREGK